MAPRYRVDAVVAEGGMGVVFQAWDTELRRKVAIKVLKPELATAVLAARLVREAQAQARLRHPNVITIYDAGQADGLWLIFMEFVEAPTLQGRLEGGPLSLDETCRLGQEIASALGAAHREGIVHRDVKPSNIFLDGGRARLGDFGIASVEDEGDTTLTGPGQFVGTRKYMAPEQFALQVVDARADVYALGHVLLECLTGLHPGAAPTPEERWKAVPVPVEPALRRMTEPRVQDRASSAQWVIKALDKATKKGRARGFWWLAGAATTAVAAALIIIIDDWTGPAPVADLAIASFADAGGGSVGSRLAELVGSKLEWFPFISVSQPDGSARKRRARFMVEGSVEAAVNGLPTVSVTLDVRDSSGQRYQSITTRGDTADLQRLACAVADSIVRKVFSEQYVQFSSFEDCRVGDDQAMKEYFVGMGAFRRGDWEGAERQFRKALQRDPGMLQPAWELMVARRFQREDFTVDLRRLLAARDSLPAFYVALVEAQLTPNLHERFRRYEAVVRQSRGVPKAMLLYTNELFHRGPLIGRSIGPTVDTMEALAKDDQDMHHTSVYDISMWGNIRLGRKEQAWNDFNRRKTLVDDTDRYGRFQRLAIWARFNPWWAHAVQGLLFRQPDTTTLAALTELSRLGTYFDIPGIQDDLGAVLVRNGSTLEQRATGFIGRGTSAVMRGQTTAGLALLDSGAARLVSNEMWLQQREWPVMLAVLRIPVDSGRLSPARAWLEEEVRNGRGGPRAMWTLGIDALGRGDSARSMTLLGALRAMSDTSEVARRLAAILAALQLGPGHPQAALDSTEIIFLNDSVSSKLSPFTRAVTYPARARWQLALRRTDSADRELLWYEGADQDGWPMGAPQQGEVDAVLSVLARLERGVLASERGDPAACRHLPRVRELWRHAEPSMAPLVARADSAMARSDCP